MGGYGQPLPFAAVIVVDSAAVNERRSPLRDIRGAMYHPLERNVGAAGTLSRRLALASAEGHDWVLLINDDGQLPDPLEAFVDSVSRVPDDVGAIAPVRIRLGRGSDRVDATGWDDNFPVRSRFVLRGDVEVAATGYRDIHWASSNCLLVRTRALSRQDLIRLERLWHCWEDLALCLLLRERGYRVLIALGSVVLDSYEYKQGRASITVSDKPAWVSYYSARNLVWIVRRFGTVSDYVKLTMRLVAESVLSATIRGSGAERLRRHVRGIWQGLRRSPPL